MTIQENIERIKSAKEDIRTAINEKGGTLAEDAKLSEFAEAVENMQSGQAIYMFGETMQDNGLGIRQIRTVIIRDGVTSVGDSAYSNTSITSLVIPDSVKTLGKGICRSCPLLVSVTFPSSLKKMPNTFFAYCTALTSYSIPSHFEELEYACFLQCTNIVKIEALGNLKAIGDYMFEGCSKLKVIKLKSVSSISATAFFAINVDVVIDSPNPPFISGKFTNLGTNTKFYVPDDAVETYKSATNWSAYADRIIKASEYIE